MITNYQSGEECPDLANSTRSDGLELMPAFGLNPDIIGAARPSGF